MLLGKRGKDDPRLESMWRRTKTEIDSLITETRAFNELEEIMTRLMNCYNNARRHSSIDQQTPVQYREQPLYLEEVGAN